MAVHLDLPQWSVAAGLAMVAAVVGALAGAEPTLAIAAALAFAFMMLTLANLTAGLAGFVLLSFLELVPTAAGPALSLAKVAGGVLALSWLAIAASESNRRHFMSEHGALTLVFLLILGWTGLSVIWAEDTARVPVSTLSFALNFALFPIVYTAVDRIDRARWVLGAFIAGATFAAAYGMFAPPDASGLASSPGAADGLDRLAGTIGDPNEFATLLVAGMALTPAFIFDSSERVAVRVASGLAAAVMLAGVLLTLSRGGLVALGAALLMSVLVARGQRLRILLAAGAVVCAAFFFYFSVTSEQARERVTATDGGSGRTDIWDVGWRMVEDKPVVGVGAGNFQVASIHYLIAPGGVRFDEYLVDQPSVAHNAYLQVLAETGVVGLTLFILAIGGCVVTAVKAATRSPATVTPPASSCPGPWWFRQVRSWPASSSSQRSTRNTCGSCSRWGPRCSRSRAAATALDRPAGSRRTEADEGRRHARQPGGDRRSRDTGARAGGAPGPGAVRALAVPDALERRRRRGGTRPIGAGGARAFGGRAHSGRAPLAVRGSAMVAAGADAAAPAPRRAPRSQVRLERLGAPWWGGLRESP